ncbi:MAG TPA: sigma-70 family RNA polymerase sigma factor [Terriglobales bacterium]|nr:sigma-70 family RNA polymerase sigma factor [Terriglobales bacterium]
MVDAANAPTDATLVMRIRARDEAAFAAVYDRYAGLVHGVALRILKERTAAEDVLQDVFLGLWCKPEAFDSARGALAPWLAVIARNRALDHLRQLPPAGDFEQVVVSVPGKIGTTTETAVTVRKVREVLATIPAQQREALEMSFFDGLTHSEIANKTGVPLGTIKGRIRAAVAAVQRAFERK